jgi:hypothetical protein
MSAAKLFPFIVLVVGTPPKPASVWSPVLVPETVAFDGTVSVAETVPPAIVNPFAADVGVKPLTVLFVSASTPANVARVPDAGNVTFVAAPTVNVVLNAPLVVRFPPSVIVLAPLLTPVPPYCPVIRLPFQVPEVIVPTVAISVPMSFEEAIDPASIPFVTFNAPIVVTPVFDIVISPVTAVDVGTFVALPTIIFALVRFANLEYAIPAAGSTSALIIWLHDGLPAALP